MSITRPEVIPPWADSGDKVQPSNAEIEAGWPSSAVPPSRQRFNWVLNYCMNGVRYLSRRGIADWDADETYAIGDRVIGPTGQTYQALTANTNKTPASNPSDWATWGFGPGDIATANSDNSSKLATTSWIRSAMSNIASAAGFSSVIATNGYIRLPSWLGSVIFQWGYVGSVPNGATGAAITFPIAFPNEFVFGQVMHDGAGVVFGQIKNVSNPLTGGNLIHNFASAVGLKWFAVGF